MGSRWTVASGIERWLTCGGVGGRDTSTLTAQARAG
jgi:hypothetical protein